MTCWRSTSSFSWSGQRRVSFFWSLLSVTHRHGCLGKRSEGGGRVVCTGTGLVPSVLRGFGCGVLLTDTHIPSPILLWLWSRHCGWPKSPCWAPALLLVPCPAPLGPVRPAAAVPELHLVPAAAADRGRRCPGIPRGNSSGQGCRLRGALLQVGGKENSGRLPSAILSFSLGC